MNIARRVIHGADGHRSRFHTYAGDVPHASQWFCDLPRAVGSTLLLKLFGYRAARPWLGYRAVARLGALIQPDWRILEFGSGMSTMWLAPLCREVVSVETSTEWASVVRGELKKRGILNVTLLERSPEKSHDVAFGQFDLVIVDGGQRDLCMQTAVTAVKPGGWLFLDNSDVPWAGHPEARSTLVAASNPGTTETFANFCPFMVQACESILGQNS